MFSKIDKLKKILEDKRPLYPELMTTIAQKFREEWTYNTNAIEGNTMTLQETAFFLREGLTVQGRTLQEHLEMVNHAEAVDYLNDAIYHRNLTEGLIKEFHAMLFSGIKAFAGGTPIAPGAYKTRDNHVLTASGQIHYYASATQVFNEMEKLVTWYNNNKQETHPIEMAALFHHKLTAIHPFSDGNGRVSRLCMNFILIKNNYPPAIFRKENRREYYIALEAADSGNSKPFIQMVAGEVKHSLDLMIKEINKAERKSLT